MLTTTPMEFLQRLAEDAHLRGEVDSLESGDVEGLFRVSSAAGFSLTASDLDQVSAEAARLAELDDAALAQVSGGLNPQPLPLGGLVSLNPQPLPPGGLAMLNPQPLPPRWAFQSLARFRVR